MAYYGYDPAQYQRNYGAQAVQDIGSIIASSVQQYPELKRIEQNQVSNDVIKQEYIKKLNEVPDSVYADAGLSKGQMISTIERADTSKDALSFANDLMRFSQPLDTALTKFEETKKTQARQGYVAGELSKGAAGGQILGQEKYVPQRYGGEGGFTEQDILPTSTGERDLPRADTRGQMIRNVMERQQALPTEEPAITGQEARASLAYEAFPSDIESLKSDELELERQRIRIARGNLGARMSTLDFQKQKEANDLIQKALSWAVAKGMKQYGQLGLPYDSYGTYLWTPDKEARADDLLTVYDNAITNIENQAKWTTREGSFPIGGAPRGPSPSGPSGGSTPAPQPAAPAQSSQSIDAETYRKRYNY